MRQRLGKIRQGIDAGIVCIEKSRQISPGRPERSGGVDMTPPDPFAPAICAELVEHCRLGIVDEHNIGFGQLFGKTLVIFRVDLFVMAQQGI
jgi:hypothetical protein